MAATPRWSVSLTGIGVVGAVIGYAGAETVLAGSGWALPSIVVAAFAVTGLLSIKWREAIGVGCAVLVSLLIGFWSWEKLGRGGLPDTITLVGSIVASFVMMVAFGRRAREEERVTGAQSARQRAAEEFAPVVAYSATACVAAAIMQGRSGAMPAIVLAAGGFCCAFLLPAVATAIELVVPRRKSVAELYSRRG